MSSAFVTLPGQTLQAFRGIDLNFNSAPLSVSAVSANVINPTNLNNLKENKKVEVRWLESEAELYLRQWRKRYRQLYVDSNSTANLLNPISWAQQQQRQNQENDRLRFVENCDNDWLLTTRTILNIDLSCLNEREFSKFKNLQNEMDEGYELIFHRGQYRLVFNPFNEEFEEDEQDNEIKLMVANDNHIIEQKPETRFLAPPPFNTATMIPLDQTDPHFNRELIATLKDTNFIYKHGRLEKENIEKGKVLLDKHHHHNSKKSHLKSTPSTSLTTINTPTTALIPSSMISTIMTNNHLNNNNVIHHNTNHCEPIAMSLNQLISPNNNISNISLTNNNLNSTIINNNNTNNNNNNSNNNNNNIDDNDNNIKLQNVKSPKIKMPKPRARTSSTRRQMFICEYPGCSYQSDRNFNFLRHRRTHGKQKNQDTKRTNLNNHNMMNNTTKATTSLNIETISQQQQQPHLLADDSLSNHHLNNSACITPNNSKIDLFDGKSSSGTLTITGDTVTLKAAIDQFQNPQQHHSQNGPTTTTTTATILSPNDLINIEPARVIGIAPGVQSTNSTSGVLPAISISSNGHSYLIGGTDNFLNQQQQPPPPNVNLSQQQNIIMKDVNNLDHVLIDHNNQQQQQQPVAHQFATTLTLDQSFLS